MLKSSPSPHLLSFTNLTHFELQISESFIYTRARVCVRVCVCVNAQTVTEKTKTMTNYGLSLVVSI